MLQPVDSMRALQEDLEELKSINASLKKENNNLREQLNSARSGNSNITFAFALFLQNNKKINEI